jgi:hypothetical protein
MACVRFATVPSSPLAPAFQIYLEVFRILTTSARLDLARATPVLLSGRCAA